MTEGIKFRCHASGLFALDKRIKVLQGATCFLQRNPENAHGTVSKIYVLTVVIVCVDGCGTEMQQRVVY